MIITDPTEKPSSRFLTVIAPFFESKGYHHLKSHKSFRKTFDFGTLEIGFWFKISTLTEVWPYWHMQFEKLERLYATIQGKSKRHKLAYTIGADLANYTRWENPPKLGFELYDSQSLRYDDFSINNAMQNTIASYEDYVAPYFAKYSSYESLLDFYRKSDFRSIKEIILAKYFSLPEADKLQSQLALEVHRRDQQDEIESFNSLVGFLNNENLKDWL
jgi:hypothetical protein